MSQEVQTKETHSAGGVVVNHEGNILVVNQNGRSWSLPKGHIEKGEKPLATAKREILEESGVDHLVLIKELPSYTRYRLDITGSDDLSDLKHIHMFLFTTKVLKLAPTDPENPEARWVLPHEVAALLTHPKDKEFFTSILPEIQKID